MKLSLYGSPYPVVAFHTCLPVRGSSRITRVRMVRGSHGVSYVYGPDGTDELPQGHEAPPKPLEVAS